MMKTTMNLSMIEEEMERYASSEDLRAFYRSFGCAGLESCPLDRTAAES